MCIKYVFTTELFSQMNLSMNLCVMCTFKKTRLNIDIIAEVLVQLMIAFFEGSSDCFINPINTNYLTKQNKSTFYVWNCGQTVTQLLLSYIIVWDFKCENSSQLPRCQILYLFFNEDFSSILPRESESHTVEIIIALPTYPKATVTVTLTQAL